VHPDVSPTLIANELCGGNAIPALLGGAERPDLAGNQLRDVKVVFGDRTQ